MTSTAQAETGRWGTRLTGGGPTWLRVAVIATVLVLALVASQTCQKSSIRVEKDEAISTAKEQVDFNPTSTQIRLLRQGLTSEPFWIVSLSVPGERDGTFRELAVVRINANSGKVETVKQQR